MGYIAHIREKDGKIQTVQDHLEGVRRLSEEFGEKIGVKHLAGLAGLLHDLGKNTEQFKHYILDAVANPDNPPPRGSVDHSTAGGKLLYERFHTTERDNYDKLVAEWIAMAIISHHGGLRDYLTPNDLSSHFINRVTKKDIPEYEKAVNSFFEGQMPMLELEKYFDRAKEELVELLKLRQESNLKPIAISLMIKYIFSCLIDADRTNTRMFEEDEHEKQKLDHMLFFQESYNALMDKINSFEAVEGADHPINKLRSEMSTQCEIFAQKPSGIYTLSIPTGGGKTLASLRYALKHALQFNKGRIIFIVPYTTIIEQNAQEVRRILNNDDNILEHHSNVVEQWDEDDEDYDVIAKKLKLAKDNWDSPIIFTTMVQFLNVFYAKGTRNVTRLHNLVNSVLVFDEVQSIPIKCISLFNEALNFLKVYGNSSIVLCTATQPALNFVHNDLKISTDGEMIQEIDKVRVSFKRVEIIDRTTPQGMNMKQIKELIKTELEEINSVLIILNTKTAVRKLYEELIASESDETNGFKLFHLSTSMCPAHRKDILEDLKQILVSKQKVICVATQLIEAGVDISFDCVIRSLAGLDSIAQAAGRCNRHGKDPIRNVYIIKSIDEDLSKLPEIKIGGEQTKRILNEIQTHPKEFGRDLLSSKAMSTYFKYYYEQIKDKLNYPVLETNMYDLLNLNSFYNSSYENKHRKRFPIFCRQAFATAEKYFRVIDSPTTSIIVPYNNEANDLISSLNGDLEISELSRLLKLSQKYVINVYRRELDLLDQNDYIDNLLHGNIVALKEVAYSKEFGFDVKGEGTWSYTDV